MRNIYILMFLIIPFRNFLKNATMAKFLDLFVQEHFWNKFCKVCICMFFEDILVYGFLFDFLLDNKLSKYFLVIIIQTSRTWFQKGPSKLEIQLCSNSHLIFIPMKILGCILSHAMDKYKKKKSCSLFWKNV